MSNRRRIVTFLKQTEKRLEALMNEGADDTTSGREVKRFFQGMNFLLSESDVPDDFAGLIVVDVLTMLHSIKENCVDAMRDHQANEEWNARILHSNLIGADIGIVEHIEWLHEQGKMTDHDYQAWLQEQREFAEEMQNLADEDEDQDASQHT